MATTLESPAGPVPAIRVEDFNLLVSTSWRSRGRARREILARLRALGDDAPVVSATIAKGILAVRTRLDPRGVVRALREACIRRPQRFRYTQRWVPVDRWVPSDLESLERAVASLRDRIAAGETWRITLARRADTPCEASKVIRALAALIDARVDLTRPDRVLLVELLGGAAAVSVLAPGEVFSVVKALSEREAGAVTRVEAGRAETRFGPGGERS